MKESAMAGINNQVRVSAFAAVLVLLLGAPFAALADRASEVAALEAQCEKDREGKIKPLRDKEIEKCVAARSSLEDCQAMWSDYGNPMRLANGKMSPRMFSDLPSCVAAFKARNEFNMNGD
jgi:hypothetical protein